MSRSSNPKSISLIVIALVVSGMSFATTLPPADARVASHERFADSVAIVVTNTMPHSMRLLYEVDTTLVFLGSVGGGQERTLIIRAVKGDSVTVWALNDDPPHRFSKTFPTHSAQKLTWEF